MTTEFSNVRQRPWYLHPHLNSQALYVFAALVILVAAVLDEVRDDFFFSRLAVAVLAGIALLQTLLHLVSVMASSRLK